MKQFIRENEMHVTLTVGIVLAIALLILTVTAADEPLSGEYPALFRDGSHIYDGDTLKDIFVVIKKFPEQDYPPQTLWPGIFLKGDRLYAVTDIRLRGIDTPEKRPKKAGRSVKSLEKEKAAAKRATEALRQLFTDADYVFSVSNPQIGKYAGRTVADVLIGEDKINAATYLIENGYGKRYDGGTKATPADWGWGD